jgi:hypothetical protein
VYALQQASKVAFGVVGVVAQLAAPPTVPCALNGPAVDRASGSYGWRVRNASNAAPAASRVPSAEASKIPQRAQTARRVVQRRADNRTAGHGSCAHGVAERRRHWRATALVTVEAAAYLMAATNAALADPAAVPLNGADPHRCKSLRINAPKRLDVRGRGAKRSTGSSSSENG